MFTSTGRRHSDARAHLWIGAVGTHCALRATLRTSRKHEDHIARCSGHVYERSTLLTLKEVTTVAVASSRPSCAYTCAFVSCVLVCAWAARLKGRTGTVVGSCSSLCVFYSCVARTLRVSKSCVRHTCSGGKAADEAKDEESACREAVRDLFPRTPNFLHWLNSSTADKAVPLGGHWRNSKAAWWRAVRFNEVVWKKGDYYSVLLLFMFITYAIAVSYCM